MSAAPSRASGQPKPPNFPEPPMLLSSCPHCHDSIRIPSAAQPQTMMRCPRCQESFALHDILDMLPPEAEIISGPGALGHTVMPAGAPVSSGEGGLAAYKLAGGDPEPDLPEFRFKETGSLRPEPPMAKVDSSRPTRRPKKAEPNVAMEFVKIVVGGFAGLALAVFLIMWFAHKDPFGIAQKLPVQLYVLVPEKMRTTEMVNYANGNAPPEEEVVEEEVIDLTVETIPAEPKVIQGRPFNEQLEEPIIEEQPVDFPPVDPPPSQEFPFGEQAPLKPEMMQPKLEDPLSTEPTANEKPAPKEETASPPDEEPMSSSEDSAANPPKAKEVPPPLESLDDEPFPGTLTLEEEVAKATEATQLLGKIGAEIPPPPGPRSVPPTNVGNVDLSPVDDGEN